MCIKKLLELFHRPDSPPVTPPEPSGEKKRIALLFAINNYEGGANDLNGCLNDQSDIAKKISGIWPDFIIRQFSDSLVTRSNFIKELRRAITELRAGDLLLVHYSGHGTQEYDVNGDEEDGYDEALYLYDGSLVDDEISAELQRIPEGAHVVIAFDSCFSGSATRDLKARNRFHRQAHLPIREYVRKRLVNPAEDLNWIVFSGCGEDQTSADALFNGRYNGAFTYYWMRSLSASITYAEWYKILRGYLPSEKFEQAPELEGKAELVNQIVFSIN